ncbi:MAG TPA: DNA repair protein RecO [Bryobacteraceae bacterium]|jgi:DNA repair protein RecO (recombination protein O)|nr:DNA repair protein RecO [Bryobacteraceae bacterium]
MAVQASESIVLRTYPLKEADLIVSFFTRDLGKLRGVAPRARRPKSNFGSGLERLSHVQMLYYRRENRELVNLSGCELIHSQFDLAAHYPAGIVLDYLAEVSENLLPPDEPNERFFRLLLAVLEHLRTNPEAGVWPSVLYFSLWAVRLSGFLPRLKVAAESLEIAEEMMQTPIGQLAPREWKRQTAADLRRFLVRQMQEHIEHRLLSAPLLETL